MHRFVLIVLLAAGTLVADDYRVTRDLQVLYDFDKVESGEIADRSGVGKAIPLTIKDADNVRLADGRLQIVKPTLIESREAPTRLTRAIKRSGSLTLEAWIATQNTRQEGPARVVTISQNSTNRNLTLGQEFAAWDVRLRTTKTNSNGIPSLQAPKNSVQTRMTHLVYTHAKNGVTRIYLDGKKVAERQVGGNLSAWGDDYRIGIGNELSGGRVWLGTIDLVAIFSRDLSAEEVQQNFAAGPSGRPSPEQIAARKLKAATQHFESTVAPIIARHCLECHDAATHKGGLNLSTKMAAMKGSEDGAVIVAGQSGNSSLWEAVESDSMPPERTPLSAEEKQALRKWIDDGAVWSLTQIDPAVYQHGSHQESFVRRLTVDEYIETVRTATGVDIEGQARKLLPAELRADGFSNTAYNLNVDLKHITAWRQLAEIVVSELNVRSFVSRFSKRRKFTDRDMEDVISKVGFWLLRGPVSEEEIIAYRGITTTVAGAGGDFDQAMGLVIEAMLQSPRFLYRVETQRGDGSSVYADHFEVAARISFILWGGPPDQDLLDAASGGRMQDADIREHVSRMLKDPRAKRQSLRFASDWLNLGRLDNLRPNKNRFPEWNPALGSAMKSETLAYFEEVTWNQNKPLSALLNSPVTFASPELAMFYGLSNASSKPDVRGLKRYELTKQPGRGGLLTQGSLLTVGGDNASMVTRGLLVMHELLRGVVRDPPPCVDTTPVPTAPGLTQRAIALQRINNNSCGGCHSRFEPLAFGLEKFDGLGRWSEQDQHGNKLRDDGEILFPGAAAPVKYDSSATLMNLLAKSDRVKLSLTWKVTQYAVGRPLGAADAAIVDRIHEEAQMNGGTWPALMTAIVTSELVTQTRTEVDAEQ